MIMSALKYDKLVYRFKPEYLSHTVDGKEIKDDTPQAYFRGGCLIPGAQFNVGYGLVPRPILMDPYPHKHPTDEYLVFGSETLNAKDWDARVELTLGLGDEAEVIVIDQPMTIRIPAGLWHCPLNFVRIDTPIFFQAALLQGMFGGTYLMPDGEKELVYNGQIECPLELGKKCDCCKKCLSLSWEK
jgi:hypothetical protein